MENKSKLYQKIYNAQQTCGAAVKSEKKSGMQYNPLSYNTVTKVVKDALNENKLVLIPSVDSMEQVGNQTRCTMSAIIADIETGESIVTRGYIGYGNDTQDKGPGKAQSYAYKYLMHKVFLLDIADSEDIEMGNNQNDTVSKTINFDAAKVEIKKEFDSSPSDVFAKWFKNSKWFQYDELKTYGNVLRGLG